VLAPLVTDHRQPVQVGCHGPAPRQGRCQRREYDIWILHQLADLERAIRDRLDREGEVEVSAFDGGNELVVVRRLGDLNVDVRPPLLETAHHLG